jgi:hypothetical protein
MICFDSSQSCQAADLSNCVLRLAGSLKNISSTALQLKSKDTPILPSTPETASQEIDTVKTLPYIEPSAGHQEAALRALVKSVYQPDLPSECKLTASPLVHLPNMPTPFTRTGQLAYLNPSTTPTTQPSPAQQSQAAKSFKRVAQHQEPQSALQRTPQLCLRRLGNTHSDDDKYFQSLVKYQQEARVYGRNTWQTVEFSLRFDLKPQPSGASCKADKVTTPAALQKQLSDDLAADKSDTQVEKSDSLDVSSEPVDLISKAASYVSYVSQLLRRVSSRWSYSS